MKLIYTITILILSSVCFSQKNTQSYHDMLKTYYKNTIPTIQPSALYKKVLKGEKITLLDTREKDEFQVSKIQGAIHVGYERFDSKAIDNLDINSTIIVYCTIGARSETLGTQLKEKGFNSVYNLYGGLIYWKNQGYPVTDNKDKRTENIHVYSQEWGVWLKKGKAIH